MEQFKQNDKLVVVKAFGIDGVKNGDVVYVVKANGSLVEVSKTLGGKKLTRGNESTNMSASRFKHSPVDLSGDVETAEGTPVVVITTNGRDAKFPVLAYEGAAKSTSKYTKDGIHSSGVARRNLRNVVPKPATDAVYCNVYKNSKGGLYMGDQYATIGAADRHVAGTRFGSIKIELTEGVYVTE